MEEVKKLLDWYANKYEIEQGQELLLRARMKLSSHCAKLAERMMQLEVLHKGIYHDRKIAEAVDYLKADGTQEERKAKAIAKDLRVKEGQVEGELRGSKIMLDSWFKILDSMASQINALNR